MFHPNQEQEFFSPRNKIVNTACCLDFSGKKILGLLCNEIIILPEILFRR